MNAILEKEIVTKREKKVHKQAPGEPFVKEYWLSRKETTIYFLGFPFYKKDE